MQKEDNKPPDIEETGQESKKASPAKKGLLSRIMSKLRQPLNAEPATTPAKEELATREDAEKNEEQAKRIANMVLDQLIKAMGQIPEEGKDRLVISDSGEGAVEKAEEQAATGGSAEIKEIKHRLDDLSKQLTLSEQLNVVLADNRKRLDDQYQKLEKLGEALANKSATESARKAIEEGREAMEAIVKDTLQEYFKTVPPSIQDYVEKTVNSKLEAIMRAVTPGQGNLEKAVINALNEFFQTVPASQPLQTPETPPPPTHAPSEQPPTTPPTLKKPPVTITPLCTKCGTQIQPQAHYCDKCGATIQTPKPTVPPEKPEETHTIPITSIASDTPKPHARKPRKHANKRRGHKAKRVKKPKYCTRCGAVLQPKAKFCDSCGTNV